MDAIPSKRGSFRHPQFVWGCVALVSVAGLVATYMLFVEPPPPQPDPTSTLGS